MNKAIIIAISLLSTFAFAESKTKTAKKETAPATAISKVDVVGEIKWTGYGVGKSHAGQISINSGYVEFTKGELTGGTLTIDMATLKTGGSPKLEGHLKNEDFFHVEKFKEGTFKITKVEAIKDAKAGEATHKITGDLTIKGKTNSETFSAIITKADKGYSAKAKTQIADRTKYDIVYNSAKFRALSELGNKAIDDKIDIELDIKTK